MSFWLSAIPEQNCSLNSNVDSKNGARDQGCPTVQTNASSYNTHATHRTPDSPLEIVAIGREVVQEESHTPYEMT
jgi:hypothetical protein